MRVSAMNNSNYVDGLELRIKDLTAERNLALEQAKNWRKSANSWNLLCGKLTAYMTSHKIDITSKKAKQALAEHDAEIAAKAYQKGYSQGWKDSSYGNGYNSNVKTTEYANQLRQAKGGA